MADDPIYVVQTAEPRSPDELRAWLRERAQEARAEGCGWFRASLHSDHEGLALIEGWRTRPADEGAPRWALVAHPPHHGKD